MGWGQVNQEIIAGDRVVVNLDRAASAIVVALDEQAAPHQRVVKLKRVDNPPLGLRYGRVISSEVVQTQDIERRLAEAGIVLSLRDSRLLRSAGSKQPRVVVELEDVSDKNESVGREYVRDDANEKWCLPTMDADVSLVHSWHSTGDAFSQLHVIGKLWLKRQSDTEFRKTSEYVMVPGATEASLRPGLDVSTPNIRLKVVDVPVESRTVSGDMPRFVNVKLRDSSESMRAMLPEELWPGRFPPQPRASAYVAVPDASTPVPASAPATSAAEEEDSDDQLLDQLFSAELRGGEVDADAASSDEAHPRALVSQIKVGRGDRLRFGLDPDLEPRYTQTGIKRLISGSVEVPMKPPKLKFVFYSMTLHKDAISLVPEVTWPPFEEMLPESISDATAPLDVSKTLDKNKARDQLKDLLTCVLPMFAAAGSDGMALLAQAHHLTPVVLEYLDALLKNIARTLYDGIRELPYDAIDLLGTLNINTEYFWDLVNVRDDRVLEKLRVCLEGLVSSSPEEPETKRQRPSRSASSSPRAFDGMQSVTEREAEKQEAKKRAMNKLRIKVAKLLLEHLVDEARTRFKDDAYSTAIWRTRPRPKQPVPGPRRPGFMTQSITDRLRVAAAFLLEHRLALHTGKPGWKIFGITLAKLMNRWREGKNSSHGFPWLLDILGIVNFGESPDPFGVAFQWVKAVMYLKQRLSLHNVSTLLHALFDWHPYLDVCVQCRKRAISALACASRVLQNRTPTAADAPANIASARRRVRGLPLFDQNPECRAAQEPYWMRIFVASPIYMAGTAPGRIFLFKPADSLSSVKDVTFTPTELYRLERGHCCYPLTGNSYYVVILHESQKSVATVVADLLARTFHNGSSPVLGENCHCLKDFRSYLYGALRPGNATGEFLWHVWVKEATYGDLPNAMPVEALDEDGDAEPAVPNPEEEDLSTPPEAQREVVSAVVAQQAASGGVINAIVDEEIAGEMPASDEEEDVVDPVDELISRPLAVGAPLWLPEVRSLLKEVKDMPPSQISGSVALKDCGFAVKTWTSLHAKPPGDFPCFYELVGKNNSRGFTDVIRSKTQLVDYLRIALERVHAGGDPVQLESDRRALLASGSQGENPGDALDTDALSGADVAEDAAQSVGGSQPEASVTAKAAQAEPLAHTALLKGDPNAEAKCNEALGVFMPPVRGKFKGKRQTLKSLCKHQCAFHMVYGADASPTALDGPSEEWFEQKEGEDYLRPKIVFEDKSDIESDEVVKEFARRDALITAGGFPVNLVTLAVAMEDEPQVPRVPSTSYSSTSDATIVELRKEIRDKANVRERKLRETYKRDGFGPTPMDTVDG